MRTATSLILIAIGAILAFAVTTNTSVFNLNVAGYVIMLVGLAGLFIPRRGAQSISRRFVTRRSRQPDGSVVETKEADLPPYVVRNPGTSPEQAGLPGPAFPSIPVDPGVQEKAMGPNSDIGVPVEPAERATRHETVDRVDD
ncbi:MAG TPA: hypothetical protein VGM53_17790 [Streptosporangiaceae bacterium]|jgi:hypothetical protein